MTTKFLPDEDWPPQPQPDRGWTEVEGLSFISAADLARQQARPRPTEEWPPEAKAKR